MQKKCVRCEQEFKTYSSKQKCCSKSCARFLHAKEHRPHNWKGGINRHIHGYLKELAKGHPAADKWGYVMQHRLVMEKKLGRYLHSTERVHHKNGVRADNRPENLEIWLLGSKDPQGARMKDLWREVEGRLTERPTRDEVRAAFEQVFGFGAGNAAAGV